jgi:hypothetical protein
MSGSGATIGTGDTLRIQRSIPLAPQEEVVVSGEAADGAVTAASAVQLGDPPSAPAVRTTTSVSVSRDLLNSAGHQGDNSVT